MLVLARRVGQQIVIEGNIDGKMDIYIEVTVLEVSTRQVRLGIDAPKVVTIYRKELLNQLAKAKKSKVTGDESCEEP